ncbi:restriction endonuclease [Microbacterium luteum]|uniref:restriction endonuclease n=1 Tax=Microbacterium luteum TaxID=2782167 RepID=UPI00188833F2|nr:restriction endonuclease [Microbacterium luteum]
MLVLGVTADDKGAQLESLVKSVLSAQGHVRVRTNFVVAGGNELDIVAERESELLTQTQVTPIVGEAKAYGSPLTMPKWHALLGKLLIERASRHTTVGVLIALNGVNGHVAGSYAALKQHDAAVSIIDGGDLLMRAHASGEVADEDVARSAITAQFHREVRG